MRFLARLCFFLALLCATAAQAQTFKQAVLSASAGTAASVTVNITAGVAGDLICGTVVYGDSVTLSSVKDNNGVSYNIVDTVDDAGDAAAVSTFYLPNISGAPTSIIATFSGSASFSRIEIQEWSGIATTTPLDGHHMQLDAAGTSISSGNITTTVAGDLLYGSTDITGNNGVTLTAGSGYTIRNNDIIGTVVMGDESQIQGAAATIDAKFTVSASSIGIVAIMAFKAAVAGTSCGSLALMGVGC